MRRTLGSASIVLLGFGQSVSGYQSPIIGVALMAIGAILGIYFLVTYRRVKAQDEPLPLLNHLKLKLKEGQGLVLRLDHAFPDVEALKSARAWQVEVYRMLVAQRKDLAQKFLDGADPIEEREVQTLASPNPARFLLEEHTTCLAEIIEALESRSLSTARKRGSPALGRS
jgi:hypothetical protein